MGILGAIVEMPAGLLATVVPNDFHSGPIRGASVRHNDVGIAISLHRFLQEFQCGRLITLLRDIGFQNFTFVVDSAPKIVALTPDLHEDLVQVPPPLRTSSHRLWPALADFVGEVNPEPIHPEPDAFVANVDAALVEKVFDIPK